MTREDLHRWDIVLLNNTAVQVISFHHSRGVKVQDIHTKTELTVIELLKPASKDRIKWFCENTENVNFTEPNQPIR